MDVLVQLSAEPVEKSIFHPTRDARIIGPTSDLYGGPRDLGKQST